MDGTKMNGNDYVIDGDLAFSNTKDALKFYQTEYHNQQAEIKALKKEKWLTEIDCKQQALKQIIDMLVIQHDTLACTSYPISKEN